MADLRKPQPGQPEYGRIEPGHIPAGYLAERQPSPWGSRAVHWALTAAVLAAVVCLVGWPWPTLYAIAVVAGTGILVAGIRLLLTERRATATDPDASGRTPESDRERPDDAEPQPADQPGDHPEASGQPAGPGHAMLAALAQAMTTLPAPAPRHPDNALRARVATALVARIKQATISGPQPFGTDPLTRFLAATEYDLADVVLAELAPELDEHEQLHHQLADAVGQPIRTPWPDLITAAFRAYRAADLLAGSHRRAQDAEAAVDRVQMLCHDLPYEYVGRILAALDGPGPHLVHSSTEQPVSGPQQVDESAVGHHDVAHIARIRDAVAEAIMCGDGDCLTSHHLPKIAQLLGGVGLLEEAPPAPVMATPPLTGRMIPTSTPTCGTNLPSTDGIPCGEPAVWHIRWAPGGPGDETFPASLACTVHMEQLARTHAWYDRHPTSPACSAPSAAWAPERCTEAT